MIRVICKKNYVAKVKACGWRLCWYRLDGWIASNVGSFSTCSWNGHHCTRG